VREEEVGGDLHEDVADEEDGDACLCCRLADGWRFGTKAWDGLRILGECCRIVDTYLIFYSSQSKFLRHTNSAGKPGTSNVVPIEILYVYVSEPESVP